MPQARADLTSTDMQCLKVREAAPHKATWRARWLRARCWQRGTAHQRRSSRDMHGDTGARAHGVHAVRLGQAAAGRASRVPFGI